MPVVHQNGFSTAVRITLEVDGHVLRVAQVGEDSLILRDTLFPILPVDARIVIVVDGERRVHPVILRERQGQVLLFDDEAACRLPQS